jgi:exopolyphosphatase/guanosine-5'-triphosphate,3'-diphosphate pyrophosphatase
MTIVPRWEWRTFGETFGVAEDRLAALTPEMSQESDETYLLSTESDASAKIRDALMDVKHLQAVNGDGLEQWLPVLKGEFPLAAADAAAVLAELGLPSATLDRDAYTLEELVGEVVPAHSELRAVAVHKRRTHFTVSGAMTELSELTVDGRAARTIAIELTDPAVVIAAVRELGLAEQPNTCMALGLKTLVGLT